MLKTLDITPFTNKETNDYTKESAVQVAVGAEYLDAQVEDLQQSRVFSSVTSEQRVLGSRVSGHRVRNRLDGSYKELPPIQLSYQDGSIPGNGLGAYNSEGISIKVNGGAQDGIGKTSIGGNIFILNLLVKMETFIMALLAKDLGTVLNMDCLSLRVMPMLVLEFVYLVQI